MSRIGKKGIVIPDKTEVTMNSGVILVKGPKGSLEKIFRSDILVTINEKDISLTLAKENKQTRALWGTYASHLKNMVKGVTEGFEKKLILEGVGFKSQVTGNKLILALGFSHPVEVEIPEGLSVKAEKNIVTVSGIDKELVGSFSAKTRALKKPEPYKGKGFRYFDEVIRRKQGKRSV
ncbi:MAG: 50S ribosomal protein L6 [Candidatus Paceibacterota bacterium]|jgi:large subunit ribosomal protein L6